MFRVVEGGGEGGRRGGGGEVLGGGGAGGKQAFAWARGGAVGAEEAEAVAQAVGAYADDRLVRVLSAPLLECLHLLFYREMTSLDSASS